MTELPTPLALNGDDQAILTGLLLHLWTTDLKHEDDGDLLRTRTLRRDQLRFERRGTAPDGRDDHDPVEEESFTVLREGLRAVQSEAHGLQLLVTACASEPWRDMDKRFFGELRVESRRESLEWAAGHLPGAVGKSTVEAVDEWLRPGRARQVGQRLKGLATLRNAGVIAGSAITVAATAGVAAPAIGAAVGGAMGLTGAAATSAGLAALGGGSIASGGFGMAGGTVVVGALGATGGGGLGAVFVGAKGQQELGAQTAQLRAQTSVGRSLGGATARVVDEQIALVELDVARGLHERTLAGLDPNGEQRQAEIAAELQRVVDLRRALPIEDFQLP